MSRIKHTGRDVLRPDVIARLEVVRARLARSASGYVRISRVGSTDRTALSVLIERGEVEIFESPLGRAYRLVQ